MVIKCRYSEDLSICFVFLAVTGAHLVRLYERFQSLDKDNKGYLR